MNNTSALRPPIVTVIGSQVIAKGLAGAAAPFVGRFVKDRTGHSCFAAAYYPSPENSAGCMAFKEITDDGPLAPFATTFTSA